MTTPVRNEIGTVFIPVSDIEKARDWYSHLLGVPNDGEIVHGHLYILPMKGTGAVLDSRIYKPGKTFDMPVFHLNTPDIDAAYDFMKSHDFNVVTEIQHNHFFHFKDPDGNLMMICQC
ncbi:VOC family protein [Halobacillus halophilus]|uniref:VOC family protein n=1 Tax=Halobacillus halophilus TaxID=1570 RepID=UPI0013709A11|nr:VOC family protein [Halobacillus halophilus]MYL28750.1 VOC family protein [Halobacillus halophilus]